jgi:acyl-coenzyme A thioesterase PaaI-like protein
MNSSVLSIWNRCAGLPLGKRLFSRIVCLKAPYFGSIHPLVSDLTSERCEVLLRKRRSVQNHIGTVHAIAMCNMAELAAGLLTDAAIPASHRWIPKGMTVEYLAKAETSLRATASFADKPLFAQARELPVLVEVRDRSDVIVFRARIAMWISPKRA